jgi:hypothetical protein
MTTRQSGQKILKKMNEQILKNGFKFGSSTCFRLCVSFCTTFTALV